MCLDKIKFKMFEQGQYLMKQEDHVEYAYLILHGVVNLYNEDWASEHDEFSSEGETGMLMNAFGTGIKERRKQMKEKYDDYPINGEVSLFADFRK